MRKDIDYWGSGFLVRLMDFPAYKDGRWYGPDVQMNRLHALIALKVIEKPFLLSGNELAYLRGVAELSRSEAARQLGVTRRTLINWEEEGDRPIKARPIMHLGLRTFFFAKIFKESAMPSEAMRSVAKLADQPVELTYKDVRSRFGSGFLSIEKRPATRTARAGGVKQPLPFVRARLARKVSGALDSVPVNVEAS
jgi:DNA-binding XRE family transcriptional regulator